MASNQIRLAGTGTTVGMAAISVYCKTCVDFAAQRGGTNNS